MAETVDIGDIIQIIPKDMDPQQMFGACLFIVDEVRSWGVMCFMIMPSRGIVPYRAATGEFVTVGKAVYTLGWTDG